MRAIQFWLQLLGYSYLHTAGCSNHCTTAGPDHPDSEGYSNLGWTSSTKTNKHDLEWDWGTYPFLGNVGYRSPQDICPVEGPQLLLSRSACDSLSLFERKGPHISSLAFQNPLPSSPCKFLTPPFTFFTDISFDFRQEAIFHVPYISAQLVLWSNCTSQENGQAEYGSCTFWPCSFLTYPAATLLLTAVTDDYNYSCLNYSV